MLAVIVSTTIASVTELFGRLNEPETYKLVVVAFVATRFEIFALPKLATPETYKFVEVAFTNIALVEVKAVPLALVKNNGPVSVPPASGR